MKATSPVRQRDELIPTGPFDMAKEDTENTPTRRTKSRAYKIAVRAGLWGAHQFFLNNPTCALIYWLVLGTLVGFPSWLGAWPGVPLALFLNGAAWLYAIYSMAVISEDDPRLRGHTSANYHERMIWFCKIPLWGIDFWKKAREDRGGL